MLISILKLMSGSGLGQLIQFLSIPILTNFYRPEEFAVFALIIATSSVMVVISSLQLNVAIITTQSDAGTKRVLKTAICLNLLMILVSILIAVFLSVLFFNGSVKLGFVASLVVLVFFTAINNIFRGVLINRGRFGSLAKMMIARSIIIVFSQMVFSRFDIFNGLILGLIVGEVVVSILMLVIQLNYRISNVSITKRRLLDIKVMMKKLRDFMFFGTMQEITSLLILWSPFFAISALYGETESGFYSIASRILWPATILVTSSVSNVLFRQFERMQMKEIKNMTILSNKIKILYMPILMVSYYITPIVFSLILPQDWAVAADMSKYVALLCLFFLYIVPFRVLFRVLREQNKLLRLESCYLIILVFYFLVIYGFYDIDIYTFLNGLVALNFLLMLMIEFISKKRLSENV